MPRSDDPFDRLRAAIDEVAAADAADLLAEARIEARARIRATLTDALAHSMLERLHEQLPGPRRETPPLDESRAPARDPVPSRTPAPRRSSGSDEPAWYVYGVVGADAELSGALPGVDPAQPVTILREDALAAVTSQVPLDEFDEARLREHLADMAWVEATARAHENVLDRVCAQTTVIPMRMCTVYRTEGGVREMLHREADALLDALDHLHEKAEWGAKAFVSLDGSGQEAEGGAVSSGAAYMERKRTERERRQHALEVAEDAVAVIHDRLSTTAADAQTIPLQHPEASGHSGEMILNGVYLVADESLEHFHQEVRALQAEFSGHGIELVCTGPWPAYNFVPGTIGAAW